MAVKNCGLPKEEVYSDLSHVSPDTGYFVTLIVKE